MVQVLCFAKAVSLAGFSVDFVNLTEVSFAVLFYFFFLEVLRSSKS